MTYCTFIAPRDVRAHIITVNYVYSFANAQLFLFVFQCQLTVLHPVSLQIVH